MKRLYLSIVFSVFGSLFLISMALDYLVADKLTPTDIVHQDNVEVVLYQQLIEGFSRQLNDVSANKLSQAVEKIQKHHQINLNIEQLSNIALPATLLGKLSQPGGLLLASESESYLLRKLTQHPTLLIQLQLPIKPSDNQEINLILTATLYLGVCVILIIWLLPLTRRLYLLTTAAAKIGAGQLDVRVVISKFSYIDKLEISFNRMAGQIEKLVADNKILARSLSHDIRTPMSCLRFGIEAAMDSKDLSKKNQYLGRMDIELTRMEDMTSAFLEYAGMERHGFHLKNESININEFIKNICAEHQSLALQHNIELHFDNPKNMIEYQLDYHWCYRAIQNLIGNAIQHAKKEVHLSIYTNHQLLKIKVEDDGEGIPQEKLSSVFAPFVKLDNSRPREDGHFGLGLAITEKIMDWHNGEVTAQNSTRLCGACFTLSFPLIPSS